MDMQVAYLAASTAGAVASAILTTLKIIEHWRTKHRSGEPETDVRGAVSSPPQR